MASGRIVPGAASRADPVLDPRLGRGEEPPQLGVVRVGGHLDVGDDGGAIVQVVEHQQRVGHHHDGVGQVAVVGRRVGERLDRPHDVVAQIAHGAAGEARQPGHVHRRMPAEQAAQVLERGHVGLDDAPAVAGGPARARAPAIAEHLARIGRQEGVPGPALAALERLEQEAVRPAVELGEGGDRRVAVEHDLAGHRHHRAALAGAGGERVEGGGHRGGGHEVGARRRQRRPEIVGRRAGGGEQGELRRPGHDLAHRQRPLVETSLPNASRARAGAEK